MSRDTMFAVRTAKDMRTEESLEALEAPRMGHRGGTPGTTYEGTRNTSAGRKCRRAKGHDEGGETMSDTKRCSACRMLLPLVEFYVRPDRPGKRRSRCRSCFRRDAVERRARIRAA